MILASGEIVEKLNRAVDPTDNFEFQPEDLVGDVVATWHTHPSKSSNLSIADYWFFIQWSHMHHFVVSDVESSCYVVTDGTVRVIDEAEDYPPWLPEGALS